MSNETKFCPVTLGDCREEVCAWWRRPVGCCSITTIASALHGEELELSRVVNELYEIRKELENR